MEGKRISRLFIEVGTVPIYTRPEWHENLDDGERRVRVKCKNPLDVFPPEKKYISAKRRRKLEERKKINKHTFIVRFEYRTISRRQPNHKWNSF